MKTSIAILLSSVLVSQAALIPFGLSPGNTDAAIGLSPANVVPPVLNSTGSGGPISGGLVFDTDTRTLTLAVGYGSAAGFTDLNGAVTNLTLNGPAPTNQNAGVLANLATFNFPAVNPAKGGVIYGSLVVATNAVADLMAGLDYLSVGHAVDMATNTTSELRGQLISLLPTISCPEPMTVECGSNVVLTAQVGSPAGNALAVVWSLNDITVQTNLVPAGAAPTSTNVVFSGELPLGTNNIGIAVADSAGYVATCGTTVTVVDTIPPVIVDASASPDMLWPPNHKMVTITVSAVVTDNCGPATWKIIKVRSNESVNGKGDGNTSPDWQILGDHTVALRAERSGRGSGRIYTITLQAKDTSGNLSSPATVTVTVPKSKGKVKTNQHSGPKGPKITWP